MPVQNKVLESSHDSSFGLFLLHGVVILLHNHCLAYYCTVAFTLPLVTATKIKHEPDRMHVLYKRLHLPHLPLERQRIQAATPSISGQESERSAFKGERSEDQSESAKR
jgi:hypothetical protein